MTEPLMAEALHAGYRSRTLTTEVVRNLNAALRPGEFACLVGVNGAGKSTLLRTLAGLQAPLSGRVMLGEGPVTALSGVERARRLSLVLTERSFARHLRGLDVVRLGRHPHTSWVGRMHDSDHAMVEEAIALTACEELVEKPMASMSDGERQRILIARAVAQAPRVMLLDEPTAFLDVAHRSRLTAMLRELTHRLGIAVLMSTHDLELTLRTADTVWFVRGSGRVEVAPPEDIVLQGILTEEFPDDRLVFDHEAGGFRMIPVVSRTRITVAGDVPAGVLWTARALAREGFDVSTANATNPDVVLDRRLWHLADGRVATSIAELLNCLKGDRTTGSGADPQRVGT